MFPKTTLLQFSMPPCTVTPKMQPTSSQPDLQRAAKLVFRPMAASAATMRNLLSVLIAEAFRCSHLVFAAPTYNNGVYPAMYNFLHDMGALSLQNRTIGLIENGTWGPVSAKQMQQLFSEMKQMNVLEPVVTVKSSVKEDSLAALCALKDRILASCTK